MRGKGVELREGRSSWEGRGSFRGKKTGREYLGRPELSVQAASEAELGGKGRKGEKGGGISH